MIIKKFQAKTEEAALELARKELGSGIVVMKVKKVKMQNLFYVTMIAVIALSLLGIV